MRPRAKIMKFLNISNIDVKIKLWGMIMHYLLCGSYGNYENRKRSASASLLIVSIMIFLYGAPKGTKSQKTRILGQIWPILTHFRSGTHFPGKIQKNRLYRTIRELCPLRAHFTTYNYGEIRIKKRDLQEFQNRQNRKSEFLDF